MISTICPDLCGRREACLFGRRSASPAFSKLCGAFLLCLLALLPAAAAAQTNSKIRNLQRQQTSLKKDIARQEGMLRSNRRDVRSQLANLQVINVQIEGQQKYVDGIHSELSELAGSIAKLERQLALLEADLNKCKRQYQRAVNYMFRNRNGISKWQFILSARTFRQMYRRMRYMREFSRYQVAQGRVIQAKERQVEAKRAELLGVRQAKNKLLAEGRKEVQKLEGQQKERQAVVNELNRKQKELQATIAQQRRKAAQLDARIDKLIQEEIAAAERRRKAEAERRRKAEAARQARLKAQREKTAAEEKARQRKASRKQTASAKKSGGKRSAASKNNGNNAAPRFNEADNADRALSGSFAANRGRLPMPITGSYAITTHYGAYNVPGLKGVRLDSKGINITGRPGAQARCVFEGEVTAVFSYGGLYNVIVRHGSYMSVYCNLSSISVRRGQKVAARQTIGAVATDASGNCTLHFQLRRETAKLNPEAWLGR